MSLGEPPIAVAGAAPADTASHRSLAAARARTAIPYVATVVALNAGFSHSPDLDWFWSLLVGSVLVLRDFTQRVWGHGCLALMALAAVLSYLLGSPEVALASAAAFAVSETVDWLVFTVTRRRFAERVLLSTTASAPVDSAVFLGLAHLFTWPLFALGVASKCAAGLAIWAILRWRQAGAATLLLALAADARAADAPRGAAMIAPGLFYREDVAAASPGEWQALCATPRGLEVATTAVRIRVVPAPHADPVEDPDGSGGRLVEADGCPEAVVLLRGRELKEGPVQTVAFGSLPVPKETVANLRLGTSPPYYLQAEQKGGEDPVVLLLSQGERRQAVASIAGCCNDTWPAIVWAGDLDRDGGLDLLLNVSGHYAGSELALFLSSAARKGDLVGEVARFASSSC